MAKKELTYRGLTTEEMQKLPQEEMQNLLTSRGRRSLKRGIQEQQDKLLERVAAARKSGDLKKSIKTHCRDMIIIPEMVGLKFGVYNGKEFVEFETTLEMVGHYLGEFALCRRPVKHSAPGVGATRSSLFVPVK